MASLLSRWEINAIIDNPCDKLMKSHHNPPLVNAKDIWDSKFLRTFHGPLPSALFVDRMGEGHLAFSLNVDFFNVEDVWVRGETTSCSVITCACLNLPLEICYKLENMYLAGIIPGLHEPHGNKLNHFLDPLIEGMVESWEQGIHFNHTALHPSGQVVRSAIACMVCDFSAV